MYTYLHKTYVYFFAGSVGAGAALPSLYENWIYICDLIRKDTAIDNMKHIRIEKIHKNEVHSINKSSIKSILTNLNGKFSNIINIGFSPVLIRHAMQNSNTNTQLLKLSC